MMNRLIAVVLLELGLSAIMFGAGIHGARQSSPKKHLPLENLPNAERKTQEKSQYLPDRVIVKMQPAVASGKALHSFGVAAVDNYVQRFGAQSIEHVFPHSNPPTSEHEVDLTKFYLMKFSAPMDAFKVAGELSQLPEVEYAEPLFLYAVNDALTCTPNDTGRHSQWNLNKILADSAFCISQGDTSVIIGIIDTGVQTDHPDLAPNIWHNAGEIGLDALSRDKRTNGVDDDGNGYIDDWQGWDFGGADYNNPVADNDPSPKSISSGHGTHVAGVASAATNNTVGIAGIGNKSRIMAVKTSSDNDTRGGGEPLITFGFEGIVYAADNGAKAINCSWGGPQASQFEQEVVNYATGKGALVVSAAGNGASGSPNYPAAYNNVMSVAATAVSDKKPAYSNYGTTVDVCAPGGDPNNDIRVAIYSTDYPSTYGISAGTSFSSPLVAGLAALVKSMFPTYTSTQVGEQIRVTCDDIDAVNPFFAKQLGKGRINAVRALTQSYPAVRMQSFTVSDSANGNNNGSLEPNEIFSLGVMLTNYLQSTSPSAVVTLTSADTNVQITSGNYAMGGLTTFQVINNASSPFLVYIKSNPEKGHLVKFTLLIDDGTYHDFQSFFILINPTFATHNINNIHTTITNNGRIGFNDFPDNTQGEGFTFQGGNQLFEAGLLLGYSPTKLVDVVRNPNGIADADFISSQIFTLKTPGDISAQDGLTAFTDSAAATVNRIGVQVTLHSYAFTSPADSNYIILRYDIKNISGTDISNFYAGLFFDWDVLPDFNFNKTGFDPTRSLGIAWDNTTLTPVYCGARALDGASGYRGLVNGQDLDLTRSGKWAWLSGGIVSTDSITDIHFTISSGPYVIASGSTQTVGFAMLGGTSLEKLQNSADAAAIQWDYIRNGNGHPQSAQLIFPPEGQTNLTDTVLLRWSSAIGAVKYRVQVAKDAGFTNLVYDDSLTATTTYAILPHIDTTYNWRVQTINAGGLISYSNVGTFSTGIPLQISIPVLQNSVLSQYADFIVTSNLPLLSVPTMTVAVGGTPADTVPLTQIATQIYKGSFQFGSSGGVVVRVHSTRTSGAESNTQRTFVVQLVKQGQPGSVSSFDHTAILQLPTNGISEETYFTIIKESRSGVPSMLIGVPYTFGPAKSFSDALTITLQYPEGSVEMGNERYLHLYRSTGSGWIPIETYVNTQRRTISASTTSLGEFSIGYDEHLISKLTPTEYSISQNYPNPFNPETKIQFSLPEGGKVRLRIVNVMGQEIIRLVDEDRPAGIFEEIWRSSNSLGAGVASGVYFYKLEVTDGAFLKYSKTQKMLLLK